MFRESIEAKKHPEPKNTGKLKKLYESKPISKHFNEQSAQKKSKPALKVDTGHIKLNQDSAYNLDSQLISVQPNPNEEMEPYKTELELLGIIKKPTPSQKKHQTFGKKASVPVKKSFQESSFLLPKIKRKSPRKDRSVTKLSFHDKEYRKTDALIK